MEIADSIILGVVSGILTSALIYLILLIGRKLIIPWYQALIYKGIDISGEWYADMEFENGNIQNLKINITQKAYKITALVTISKKIANSDKHEIKTYKHNGEIRERFVTLVGRNIDKQSIGVNSILMEVIGNGKEMKGHTLRYSVTNKEITSGESSWMRKN